MTGVSILGHCEAMVEPTFQKSEIVQVVSEHPIENIDRNFFRNDILVYVIASVTVRTHGDLEHPEK
jgi:hypothetical protein